MREVEFRRALPHEVAEFEAHGYRVVGASTFSDGGITVLLRRDPATRDDRPAGEDSSPEVPW